MIVNLRIDVSDEVRTALRKSSGKRGLATRREITSTLHSLIEAHWLDTLDDVERSQKWQDDRGAEESDDGD